MIKFKEDTHSYTSLDGSDTKWISVTTLVSNFKQPFADNQAEKSSKNKKSPWYGMSVEEISNAWSTEGKRSTDLGTWYHNQRESDLISHNTIRRDGIDLPIIKPIWIDNEKIAPEQKLINGIYPEHFVYLKSAGICGQSDIVEVVNNIISISDYKTCKVIKTKGFINWEGIVSKMLPPFQHLDDCHFNHYALQLSLYMYMIIKYNPTLKPGKLRIDHIIFEEQDKDKYGYPVYKTDPQGNFIVKEVIPIELPYLKNECITLINWLKTNRDKIKSKK